MERIPLLLRSIWERPGASQRTLAADLGISLGSVNTLIKEAAAAGYISPAQAAAPYDPSPGTPRPGEGYALLPAGQALLDSCRVDGALILAAGFGSRFVPLTFETPKGLLEVFGERMVERQIKQLHEVGVTDITIMVGYLKEKFEYLIDLYGVKLRYNPEYATKNTLATLYHARDLFLGRNMYLLASDHWMRENPFHRHECRSWNACAYSHGETAEWCLRLSKKDVIEAVTVGGHGAWYMYGPVFLRREWSDAFFPVLSAYYASPGTEQFYWEQVIMDILDGEAAKRLGANPAADAPPPKATADCQDAGRHVFAYAPLPPIYGNKLGEDQVYEFENLEELRAFDPKYREDSGNRAMALISQVLCIPESHIRELSCLKAGMTNRSFLFDVDGQRYICRIPGAGTEKLINRRQEKAVFEAVAPLGISERVVHFDADTGYKISHYYEGSHNCDAKNAQEVAACMATLRAFHEKNLSVPHDFDIGERIAYYEGLCGGYERALFEDYPAVRAQADEALAYLGGLSRPRTLAHIDSVCDNFLMLPDGAIRLIDWEYAGMCDPLIDIAMFAIYSYYNEPETAALAALYFGRPAAQGEWAIIRAYVRLSGLLWALWAIFKSKSGEEFGDYTITMYRYAKGQFPS